MIDKTNWKKAALYILIAAAVGDASYRLWQDLVGSSLNFQQSQMPPCDSTVVRQLLADTIKQGPRALQTGLKLIQIAEIYDYTSGPDGTLKNPISLDPKETQRFCKAHVFTSAGSGDVHFNLTWTDVAKDTLYLETTVVTF